MRQLILCLLATGLLQAETGRDAWLRYDAVPSIGRQLPAVVFVPHGDPLVQTAAAELVRGIRGMTGKTLRLSEKLPTEPAIVLGTIDSMQKSLGVQFQALPPEGYRLWDTTLQGQSTLLVIGADDRAVSYAVFALLRLAAQGQLGPRLDLSEAPKYPIRWVNHWDNLDGTMERGYGGRSIFWENGISRADLSRVSEYARLLASVGIQATTINNVNANPKILTAELLPHIKRIADELRIWGVRTAISVDFGSPRAVGGLDTFDPLDPRVSRYWKDVLDAVYREVPDLAGVVLKADSEGRVGPSFYQRTHADAANVVARALAPHGGLLFYRGFVYDHHMDWKNPKNDRARAAVDNFLPLDGKFDSNVIVQIKNGPIDFQVREPVSPLFGALEHTNQALELQITQEYFGQARHTVFLVPEWKEILDFDLHIGTAPTPVKKVTRAIAGVSNVGLDENWFGNHMSQANLYGYGRLAWDPDLGSETVVKEWSGMTFGLEPKVTRAVTSIQLQSWRTYENYTGPLGLQTLTDIVGNHFGVAVEASEKNGWGQWHNADKKGVGMDRTTATGTGYAGQYRPAVASTYESAAQCPDDLLLFFHHVPYTQMLRSGKTVIQTLYDLHYRGAQEAAEFVQTWRPLQGLLDDRRYLEILNQLEYQASSAEVWRDAVNEWFLRESGIPDRQDRVGRHPGRIEAEAMELAGYSVLQIQPWEAASGGRAVRCTEGKCTARVRYEGPAGWHSLRVQYFDMPMGIAKFRVSIQGQTIDSWDATDTLPARKLDASASKRRVIDGIALRTGDLIEIEGTADGQDPAALDFIEILPIK